MKALIVFGMCLSVPMSIVGQANLSASRRNPKAYANLPLTFEANQGQSDPKVKFLSRGDGYSLFLTSNEAVLALNQRSRPQSLLPGENDRNSPVKSLRESKSAVLCMKLLGGANSQAEVTGENELPGKSNYFIGRDQNNWHTDVRQFAKVRYQNVYPGVDLVYYGHQRDLEYDFVLHPGASPRAIRLSIEGAGRPRLEHGEIIIASSVGIVRLRSPHVYQDSDGVRREVRGRYVIKNNHEVGFEVARYDRRRELLIDPVLSYATFLGGSADDDGNGIAVDSAGNAYVTGTTFSTDFPTVNAIQSTFHGGRDVFVTKINADGTALGYSTYLGGSGSDFGIAIALDSAGNAYVSGTTDSTDFPTVNAFQSTNHGNTDVFVTKIAANGAALIYSTYLGGSGNDRGGCCNGFGPEIALDSTGNAYLSGTTDSTDFPIKNAIQPVYGGGEADAFVTKFRSSGALVYSTYLGGSQRDEADAIAVSSTGAAFVTGWTGSTDFPIKNAFQSTNHGGTDHGDADAFVTKINPVGSALVYSTYLGGNDFEQGFGIAVDSNGNAYVTGVTWSADFPTANAIQPTLPAGSHAFVTKFKPTGSAVVYSTYLGSSGSDHGYGIKADASGNAYVTGYTSSGDFPIVNAIHPSPAGGFVTSINSDGSAFIYSTYLNSFRRVALDSAGNAYLVGSGAFGFPATPLAFQLSPTGGSSAVVAKLALATSLHLSVQKVLFATQLVGTTSAPRTIRLTNQGASPLTFSKIYIAGLNPTSFTQTNNCGTTLAAGAGCNVSVTFSPTVRNTRQAGLGFSSADPASPDAVTLTGAGTVVSLSTTKLSFGNQAVGTTSPPQNITLTNTGSTPLNFGRVVIFGNFSQTNTCAPNIPADGTCTITIRFNPIVIAPVTGRIYINDDGGGSPQSVLLSGTGT